MTREMTGAEMVIQALADQGVKHLFGYPGGAVLPIYDAIFAQKKVQHVLVRHEQGAVHAAEGYARSTGKVGCVLVTSGPGATNAVTGLTDALMDSIPIVCITGQVPTHLIGNDAFQEADTVGITRPCTKHNYLVKRIEDLPGVLHEAFHIASTGRPGPVVVDIPKDIQFATGVYSKPKEFPHSGYKPKLKGDMDKIRHAVEMMAHAKKPLFYTGGGVINSGKAASDLLRELVKLTGFPITSTLMGLGAYPGTDKQWLGMLGMHGTLEANMAMHDCDVMVCVGARFDDRITGRLDAFSPGSKKIHIDIDPSSINKNVHVDLPIVGDCAHVLGGHGAAVAHAGQAGRPEGARRLVEADRQVARAQVARLPAVERADQAAIRHPAALRADQGPRHLHHHRSRPAPDVGGAVLQLQRAEPLDDLGRPGHHGLRPAGFGRRADGAPGLAGHRHRRRSHVQMTMQELSTAVQYRLPVKIFILNNGYMGMVRQWQELLHGGRYAESYSEALPDFVKLAEAMHAYGIRCEKPGDLDHAIKEMIDVDKPVLFDCVVDPAENCFPMIPSGRAHNEMLLSGAAEDIEEAITEAGKVMV